MGTAFAVRWSQTGIPGSRAGGAVLNWANRGLDGPSLRPVRGLVGSGGKARGSRRRRRGRRRRPWAQSVPVRSRSATG